MDAEVRSIRALDGVELRYEVAGDGPHLVMLHGALAGRAVFRKIRPSLGGDHRLILTVLRGHEGAEPVLPAGYGLDTTEVGDLHAVLDDAGVDRVRIVGHSTGASIAVAFALRYPDRVERMALIEPSLWSLLDDATLERVRRDHQVEVDRDYRGATPDDQFRAMESGLKAIGGVTWAALPEAERQKTLDKLAPLAGLAMTHLCALSALQVTEDDIRSLKPPTLLIYGVQSAYFEAPIAERFRQLRPDFPQLHIDGAGHNSHLERPETVGPAIADFFKTEL